MKINLTEDVIFEATGVNWILYVLYHNPGQLKYYNKRTQKRLLKYKFDEDLLYKKIKHDEISDNECIKLLNKKYEIYGG